MIEDLKLLAEQIRTAYRCGKITRKEALNEMKEYIDAYNLKVEEIAKKYNQKPRYFNFNAFMR